MALSLPCHLLTTSIGNKSFNFLSTHLRNFSSTPPPPTVVLTLLITAILAKSRVFLLNLDFNDLFIQQHNHLVFFFIKKNPWHLTGIFHDADSKRKCKMLVNDLSVPNIDR